MLAIRSCHHFKANPMSRSRHSKSSATLKLSARSVMLYSCEYDRTSRATRQRYIAGFSRSATSVPHAFMSKLRAHVADAERRQAILETIESASLVPARRLAAERERRNANVAAVAPIAEARRALGRAARCVGSVVASVELSEELSRLDAAYAQFESMCPGGIATGDSVLDAFRKLAASCEEVIRAVQAMPRGAAPSAESVNAWQRSWYAYQDMLAAVTRRPGLKRPAGWSAKEVRALVEGGQDAHSALR